VGPLLDYKNVENYEAISILLLILDTGIIQVSLDIHIFYQPLDLLSE